MYLDSALLLLIQCNKFISEIGRIWRLRLTPEKQGIQNRQCTDPKLCT